MRVLGKCVGAQLPNGCEVRPSNWPAVRSAHLQHIFQIWCKSVKAFPSYDPSKIGKKSILLLLLLLVVVVVVVVVQ